MRTFHDFSGLMIDQRIRWRMTLPDLATDRHRGGCASATRAISTKAPR